MGLTTVQRYCAACDTLKRFSNAYMRLPVCIHVPRGWNVNNAEVQHRSRGIPILHTEPIVFIGF